MNEHVNFSDDQAVVHNDSELLPVFVQDTDDYTSDGLYDIPDAAYGIRASDPIDEDEDDKVLDFDIETESD